MLTFLFFFNITMMKVTRSKAMLEVRVGLKLFQIVKEMKLLRYGLEIIFWKFVISVRERHIYPSQLSLN